MPIVRVELADPPDGRVMLLGLKDAVGPWGPEGETDDENVTVPVKPTRLLTVTTVKTPVPGKMSK